MKGHRFVSRPGANLLAGLLIVAACQAAPAADVAPALAAGQESAIALPAPAGVTVRVFLPTDYQPQAKWPVVFFYSVKGSHPDTALLRRFTDGRGYIVVGMPYAEPDKPSLTKAEYEAGLRRELTVLRAARAWLTAHAAVDETRVFLAGASLGGWTVSALGEMEAARVAGMALLMAGRRFGGSGVAPGGSLSGKAVYIGTSATDPNVVAAYRAREFYRHGGAVVTIEEYPGAGRDLPADAPRLRAWLETNGPSTNRQAAAERLAEKQKAVAAETDAAKRYALALDLAEDPRLRWCQAGALQAVQAQVADLRKLPPMKEEWQAETAFCALVFQEAEIHSLAAMKSVLDGFRKLGAAFPQTHFGSLAAQYVPRIEEAYRRSQEATRQANAGASGQTTTSVSTVKPAFPTVGNGSPSRPVMTKEGNKVKFRQQPDQP